MNRSFFIGMLFCAFLMMCSDLCGQSQGQGGGRPPSQVSDSFAPNRASPSVPAAGDSLDQVIGIQATKIPVPLIKQVNVFFPTERTREEFESEREFEHVNVEVLSGKRVYGRAELKSFKQWATATSTGFPVTLIRKVPIEQSHDLHLRITEKKPAEDLDDAAWVGSSVCANVVTADDVEWFLIPETDARASDDPAIQIWSPFPKLEMRPAPAEGQHLLQQLRVTMEMPAGVVDNQEFTLEILWDSGFTSFGEDEKGIWNRSVIQRFTIDKPWKKIHLFNEGALIDIKSRKVAEDSTQMMALRLFKSTGGKPLEVEIDDLKLVFKLKVEGIADDQLETVLKSMTEGVSISENMSRRIESHQQRIEEIKTQIEESESLAADKNPDSKENAKLRKKLKADLKEWESMLEPMASFEDGLPIDIDLRTNNSLYWFFDEITPDIKQ